MQTTMQRQPQETRLVGSDANDLGIEITHVPARSGGERLHAYQCGQIIASRPVDRSDGRPVGGTVSFAADLPADRHSYVRLALDEGMRVLRDGQSVAAA